MNDNIIDLEEYKKSVENKNGLDNKTKSINDLSLEEIEDANKLYKKEINSLMQEHKELIEENKRLRKILDK